MPLSEKTWDLVRTRYERGDRITDIVKEVGLSRSAIFKKIKKDAWSVSSISRDVLFKSQAISRIAECEENDESPSSALPELIFEDPFPTLVDNMQKRILCTIKKACDSAERFLENHPEGTYIKQTSFNGGTTYGLTSEIINPLVELLSSCTEITKGGSGLTINNNTQINQSPPLNIEIKGV